MHAGHEVLMEVDNTIVLIGGNLKGILGQELRPHYICLLNIVFIIINLITFKIIQLCFIKF